MEEKRTIKIELEIDDCKDCPHSISLVSKIGGPLVWICSLNEQDLVEFGSGKKFARYEVPEIPIPASCPLLTEKKKALRYAPVTLQQLQDVGLNPFAVKLLAESYALHPEPKPVAFSYEGEKDGKQIAVYVRLDPGDPTKDE